jgi:hypothetical protein
MPHQADLVAVRLNIFTIRVHPACEDKQKKLPWLQDEAHVDADEE